MQIAFSRLLRVFFAVCILCTGCRAEEKSSALKEPLLSVPAVAGVEESACLRFVQTELTDSRGGIFTNYLPGSPGSALASGHEVLSESQGLMLRYYAMTADTRQFTRTLTFIREAMDSGNIISYRVREDGSRYPVNASIDDLRILRGLMEGAQAFSEASYQTLSEQYAGRLYQTNVADGFLLDFYDESYEKAGQTSTLCFSDLKTIRLLGQTDRRWLKVESNMRKILLNSYLGDSFPFFHTCYQIDSATYSSETIRMAEALLTALHLSEAGACPPSTSAWLRQRLKEGPVYGEYSQEGHPVSKVESTAVYALCVLLGASEKDSELLRLAVDRMKAFQITDTQSQLYGAFANAETREAYSFDNLMALAALRAQAVTTNTRKG